MDSVVCAGAGGPSVACSRRSRHSRPGSAGTSCQGLDSRCLVLGPRGLSQDHSGLSWKQPQMACRCREIARGSARGLQFVHLCPRSCPQNLSPAPQKGPRPRQVSSAHWARHSGHRLLFCTVWSARAEHLPATCEQSFLGGSHCRTCGLAGGSGEGALRGVGASPAGLHRPLEVLLLLPPLAIQTVPGAGL